MKQTIPQHSDFCGCFLDSYMLRVPFLTQRTNTTSGADGRALIGLSEMVFPLPGRQTKCWPLLTLVLSPHCAKCYLWCHIWPRGSDPKLQHPVSLWRFPTELAATIPGDSLPAYFCPFQHMHRNSRYHTPHWRLPARRRLISQPQKQLFVWLNLSSLSATVFCVFLSTVQYLFSRFPSECVCLHCSLSVPFLPVKVPRLPRLICGPFVSHGSSKGLLT